MDNIFLRLKYKQAKAYQLQLTNKTFSHLIFRQNNLKFETLQVKLINPHLLYQHGN